MREDFRENYRLLGLKIAYYRKKKGYTQEQFAELIDKSLSFRPVAVQPVRQQAQGHLQGKGAEVV